MSFKPPWTESVLLSPPFTRPPTKLALLTRDAVLKAFKEEQEAYDRQKRWAEENKANGRS